MASSYSQILITGGSGFLGWNLLNFAADRYDLYYTYCHHHIEIEGCQAYQLHLQAPEEIEQVVGEIEPEVIIHTAALANADMCEQRRSLAHAINVTGTEYLVRCAEDLGSRFIYISTDLVFDGEIGHYTETDRAKPRNYYGETKLAAEKRVQELSSDYLIFRMALMYGEQGGFTQWMRNALERRASVPLYTDQYRTPLYVVDAVRAVYELLNQPVRNQIFHLAGSERMNRYDFGQAFARIFGYDERCLRPVSMQDVDTVAQRGRDCSLKSTKAQQYLNFQLSDVKTGLQAMKTEALNTP